MGRILKIGCAGVSLVVVLLVVVLFVIVAVTTPPTGDTSGKKRSDGGNAGGAGGDYLKVTGTADIPFSCAVMDGDGQQRTVDGRTPMKIPLKDMGGFVASSYNSCQKSGAKGTLKVAVYVGGEKKASNATSAAYGIADVNYPQ